MTDVVTRFWTALDQHDWPALKATLAADFVRIGMRDNEEDTCRGRENYLQFVTGVIGKFDHHDLRTLRIYYAADGHLAISETVETIQPPGQERLSMRFVNVHEIDDAGLIRKLDIFWKTPPELPPDWITVRAVREHQGS